MSLSSPFQISDSSLIKKNDSYNFSIHKHELEDGSYVVFTDGLAKHDQKNIAKNNEKVYSFVELYFLLPKYMNLEKSDFVWVLNYLEKIGEIPFRNKTYLGPGDTIPANKGTSPDPIGEKFKQNYFILTDPIILKSKIEESEINWLAIIPIFEKEYEYKNSHSAYEFIKELVKSNNSEKLDEYRGVVAKKKFFGLF